MQDNTKHYDIMNVYMAGMPQQQANYHGLSVCVSYVSFPDLKKYVANCYGCRGYQNSVPYAWI